jgi:hypothetical protein
MAIKHKIVNPKGEQVEVTTTPTRAIRFFCIECMGHQVAEVPRCTALLCPVFPYRMGKANSGRTGNAINLRCRRANPA